MVDARVFVLPQRGEVILSYPSHVGILVDGFEMRFKSGERQEEKGEGRGRGERKGNSSQLAEMIDGRIQKLINSGCPLLVEQGSVS